MAKTTVKNRACGSCGMDVRSNALFCYHCGSSVAPEVVIALKDKESVSDAWSRENNAEEKNGNTPEHNSPTIVAKPVDKPIPKPGLTEEPELKSAATMRRKPKSIQPKRVEVIWEEHENAPNAWFIAVTILLTLFAAGVLYLAMYLK
ncbi:MAG TPA: zinc ribbon domain-containing protein [Pyrinomonadaceae bacterium]|nr:zinc ribbon domain-containing protein [Pyrinomonadaceae bacterium]